MAIREFRTVEAATSQAITTNLGCRFGAFLCRMESMPWTAVPALLIQDCF